MKTQTHVAILAALVATMTLVGCAAEARHDNRVDRRSDRQDYRYDRRTDRQDNRYDRRTDRQDYRYGY